MCVNNDGGCLFHIICLRLCHNHSVVRYVAMPGESLDWIIFRNNAGKKLVDTA